MSRKIKVADIREEYTLGELSENDLGNTPVEQFARWFKEVMDHQVMEPNAMVLSTVSEDSRPTSRVVLLKGFDEAGFVFFTNYESQKSQEIAAYPHVSLLFFWPEMQRQVRIEGIARKLTAKDSDTYFHSRPRGSQLGALASPQSRPIPDRGFIERRLAELTAQYADQQQIDRPDYWGGFVVDPVRVEFWQGRASRLHDRLVFEASGDRDTINSTGTGRSQDREVKWEVRRLAP